MTTSDNLIYRPRTAVDMLPNDCDAESEADSEQNDAAEKPSTSQRHNQKFYRQKNTLFDKSARIVSSCSASCLTLLKSSHDSWHAWRSADIPHAKVLDVLKQQFDVDASRITRKGRVELRVEVEKSQKATHVLRKKVRKAAKALFPAIVWTKPATRPATWPLTRFADVNSLTAAELRTLDGFLTGMHGLDVMPTSIGQRIVDHQIDGSFVHEDEASNQDERTTTTTELLEVQGVEPSTTLPNSLTIAIDPEQESVTLYNVVTSTTTVSTEKKSEVDDTDVHIGWRFRKRFGRHGIFDGVVVTDCNSEGHYKVIYPEDDDVEHLTKKELIDLKRAEQEGLLDAVVVKGRRKRQKHA